jgi:hypothetical protein
MIRTVSAYRTAGGFGVGGLSKTLCAPNTGFEDNATIPSDRIADDDYRARFNREADLASTLWHPHIVGVHDSGEEDG